MVGHGETQATHPKSIMIPTRDAPPERWRDILRRRCFWVLTMELLAI